MITSHQTHGDGIGDGELEMGIGDGSWGGVGTGDVSRGDVGLGTRDWGPVNLAVAYGLHSPKI